MNAVRGEVPLVWGERTHCLCLTLGALAEIETALGCTSLDELQIRFRQLSTSELVTILKILLVAGGTAPDTVTRQWLNQIPPNLASQAVAEAFHAALG